MKFYQEFSQIFVVGDNSIVDDYELYRKGRLQQIKQQQQKQQRKKPWHLVTEFDLQLMFK